MSAAKYPRRSIALGPPFDDGTVPGEEPRAPQPDLAAMGAFIEHHLGLHVLAFGDNWREASRNPLLEAAVDAWAALRAPPVPASGLPSRDALAKATEAVIQRARGQAGYISGGMPVTPGLDEALREYDAILAILLATLAKEETTP